MGVIRLSPGDVRRLVDLGGLVERISDVLVSDARAPLRPTVEVGGSWFSAMVAGGTGYYVAKLVGVYPGNPGRGLPLVRGVVLLFDASTGDLLMEADAGELTAARTAATTALALRLMGARGGVLGVVGAGAQGSRHAEALMELYGFDTLLVYDPDWGRARRLAGSLGGAAVGLWELLRRSDVVVAATTSRSPVVRGEALGPGARVASIGAPKPVVELDAYTLQRAGCVLVDTREGAVEEAGCIGEALRTGIDVSLVELRDLLKGEGRCGPREVWVYKSVGTALLDLAAAIHLYERALESL